MSISPFLLDVLAQQMREEIFKDARRAHLSTRAARLAEPRPGLLRAVLRWIATAGAGRLPHPRPGTAR